VRLQLVLVTLCGCDKLFGLAPLPEPADAAIDSPTFDASLWEIGCADGTREGFTDLASAPRIAACAGAWTIGGIKPPPPPMCGQHAGNTGENLLGTDCTATDLCARFWEVCSDRLDILARLPDQTCAGTWPDNAFFATAQSGPGAGDCSPSGWDDVFGCGSLGSPARMSCLPLDRSSGNDCSAIRAIGGWDCLSPDEPTNIKKSDPLFGGGVLCCRGPGPL